MYVYIIPSLLIIGDFLTGLFKALYKKSLNSTVLRKGLYHKLAEIISLIGCGLIDYATQYVSLPFELPILPAVSLYISLMEIISIFENLCEINPVLYNFFAPYLEKLKYYDEDNKNE